ncbi:pullulanase [Clostridium pasteurianum DSM 525 = ATCC 6013]|uniref:Pullulanase n=3 Tax=Clostridium pasteurianum TaxID=1501 RepID=A0A0H3J8N1_CLOPA|nr:type I pullulanase [Clostridium pasteurianum]AJA47430.1 pullulanase [Clostridium pasteurianum DSM 525 = ATCC 6013]AJA51418.1 pullulanase [Clostridium pasteurianum DSM 525 = ATCC 6013]AOZ74756.1 pullulanase [Clostridium pasteurianum DSM 525 = ATCC 6013]AOZ78552.1 pullulanase [Clostridium pasteurianum]ELP58765.1 pullulanase [Clostridium pasteurianum DSM 525 = ATCC 6013]
MNIISASVKGFKELEIIIDNSTGINLSKFSIKNRAEFLDIKTRYIDNNTITIILLEEIDIKSECFLIYDNITKGCSYFKLFSSEEFNGRFFTLEELGLIYKKNFSDFRVWSPVATSINLLIYKNGDPSIDETPREFPMIESKGLWSVTVNEDLKNCFYTYRVNVYGNINETVDPYAKLVGINGYRGYIMDIKETDPQDFEKDISPDNLSNYTDAIVYEINIRDISINPNSGIPNKGKFLGLAEENCKTLNNQPTGIDYLKSLGITHIQIMPIFDFSYISIDETNPIGYNWGYDPENYNVPEGLYSTDPYDSVCRIKELKKMIYSIHKNGISINMDIVYNHIFDYKNNCFQKIFPGYYFRYNDDNTLSDGSGCGNDTASENLMMKKFIIDSVLYWCSEYHIDGFRIDLMGIHDTDTINILRHKLDTFKRKIMLYGEGWNLKTALDSSKRAAISNALHLPQIGFFNDIIRDTLKGSTFDKNAKGFISGEKNLENSIRLCVTGCTKYSETLNGIFYSPVQSINYVSCHDNNTLWDKLQFTNRNESDEIRAYRVKLALGIILTSQGIPFIHSGCEFLRTKEGIENSYNSPDYINWIDWNRRDKYMYMVNYIKNLIILRKNHPAFRMTSLTDIKNNLEFLEDLPKNTVAFILKNNANNDTWKNILVIYNANNDSAEIKLPKYSYWNLVVDRHTINEKTIHTYNINDSYHIDGISINILYNNL